MKFFVMCCALDDGLDLAYKANCPKGDGKDRDGSQTALARKIILEGGTLLINMERDGGKLNSKKSALLAQTIEFALPFMTKESQQNNSTPPTSRTYVNPDEYTDMCVLIRELQAILQCAGSHGAKTIFDS
jgi:hypothetical protein